MSDHVEPRDELAERAILGEILHLTAVPTEAASLVTPDDFWQPRHRLVAEVCWDLTRRKVPCDAIAVRAELQRRGHRGETSDASWLVGLLSDAQPSIAWHARQVRDIAVRRHTLVAALRAAQQVADPQNDPYDVAASLSVSAATLAERADDVKPERLTGLDEFLSGPTSYEWQVPGLLERGDRLLVTGGEGSGKSVLTRQIALCVAAGINPFGGASFGPQSVLLIDLENGTRHLRRALRPLAIHAEAIGQPIRSLHIESRPAGIDLTRPDDEQWLNRVCATADPSLLVIGPMYRMHAKNMNDEEPARHLTRTLDAIRARHDCTIVVETHAPHAGNIGPRSLRPVGSSLFMRWPEFGYGIRPEADLPRDVVGLSSWRGARDERAWPRHLRRGGEGEWPWMPYVDEREFV